MEKQFTLEHSPFSAPVEVVGDIIIAPFVPYSNHSITVKINPNTREYQEENDVGHRQVTEFVDTNETINLNFDLNGEKSHAVTINGKSHTITLLEVEANKYSFMASEST